MVTKGLFVCLFVLYLSKSSLFVAQVSFHSRPRHFRDGLGGVSERDGKRHCWSADPAEVGQWGTVPSCKMDGACKLSDIKIQRSSLILCVLECLDRLHFQELDKNPVGVD